VRDFLVHCIGDSHVSVFSGTNKISEGYPSVHDVLPWFRTYRIGPHLAYNIGNETHHGYKHLMGILAGISTGSNVLLSFGEIDCRCHIIRQAELQGKKIEDIVLECVNRYFKTITTVVGMGYNVIVWGAVPTCNYDGLVYKENEPYQHYGTFRDRNKATALFNDLVEKLCAGAGVPFLSISEHLVDSDFRTIETLYMDSIHLSDKAIPYILGRFEKIEQQL